jgi:hypothetical protein
VGGGIFGSSVAAICGSACGRERLTGSVVDDADAHRTGFDSGSTANVTYVGDGYRHDGNDGKGAQAARFVPNLPAAGWYKVLVAYAAHENRADNVPVTIRHADGETQMTLNQKRPPSVQRLFEPVGTFRFAPGEAGYVEISNAGANGYVIIDAVQWMKAAP